MKVNMHTHTRYTHTHIHAYMHTHNTHIHTYTQMREPLILADDGRGVKGGVKKGEPTISLHKLKKFVTKVLCFTKHIR